jgi:hypothetical protein
MTATIITAVRGVHAAQASKCSRDALAWRERKRHRADPGCESGAQRRGGDGNYSGIRRGADHVRSA